MNCKKLHLAMSRATSSAQRSAVSTEQAMDPLLFSNAPATAAAPPGLLNGGTAIPSAGTSGLAGIADDIAALAGAISAAGINADSMVIVTRAALAAKARILVSPKFTNEILSSPHCPTAK